MCYSPPAWSLPPPCVLLSAHPACSAHALRWLPLSQAWVGGCDDTLGFIRKHYLSGSAASCGGSPCLATNVDTVDPDATYDYDLAVIGGGSGGLACAKAAAEAGARVVLFDFVKPSPAGTTWGLGGTCVNVGCIPKKLYHQAALLGEGLHDARTFGWDLPEHATNSWETLRQGIQDHIGSLNFGYRVSLRDKGVTYKNTLASFIDAHTLKTVDKRGREGSLTAARTVIAVGGRPHTLNIPGGDLAITSDDVFSMTTAPGKTLVVGASYVALECAGFLTGLGYDTTVAVRSILLRGFDRECADMIGEYMAEHGTRFLMKTQPKSIERTEAGKLKVTMTATAEDGSESELVEEYDTVMAATGRYADTAGLNLDAVGVATTRSGHIKHTNEQTSCPNIYAIGDILEGGMELTPVAIQAGKLLAARLFKGDTVPMDYTKIATAVFTPLEYGSVGLSEEAAKEKYESVTVYHQFFTPLEWTVAHRGENKGYVKAIVDDVSNVVVGLHYLGPVAGEVIQGFGAAVKQGLTFDMLVDTVGIHPVCAEQFTTLHIVKGSGASALSSGC